MNEPTRCKQCGRFPAGCVCEEPLASPSGGQADLASHLEWALKHLSMFVAIESDGTALSKRTVGGHEFVGYAARYHAAEDALAKTSQPPPAHQCPNCEKLANPENYHCDECCPLTNPPRCETCGLHKMDDIHYAGTVDCHEYKEKGVE